MKMRKAQGVDRATRELVSKGGPLAYVWSRLGRIRATGGYGWTLGRIGRLSWNQGVNSSLARSKATTYTASLAGK